MAALRRTYGLPPVCKRFLFDGLKRPASMYPAEVRSLRLFGHDGCLHVLILTKLTAPCGRILTGFPGRWLDRPSIAAMVSADKERSVPSSSFVFWFLLLV
jgi:hypothetical protein